MNRVLVVDEDDEYREALAKALKNIGYRVLGIREPDSLASSILIHRPDVILLEMTFDSRLLGMTICEQLRSWSAIPVIIVSTLDDDEIKVPVMDAGADDYLVKPFSIQELGARIRAIGRRVAQAPAASNSHVVCTGKLMIDFDMRTVKLDDKPLHLTRKEYALLKVLAEAQGRLVSYERLLATIWTDENAVERRKVRALVMQLRQKLNEDLNNPLYVLTEAGVGYRLNMELDNTTA